MVTAQLVARVLATSYGDLSEAVILHAKKSMLNWLGAAIGASHHETIDILLAVASEVGSAPTATVLGRKEKVDILMAALANGTSSHTFDFDDTHLETIHHPSSPVAPVVFALGETRLVSAKELVRAFVLGCEAELRIARAVCPSHYDLGYHVTSSTGVFGAAVAAGLILKLDQEQLTMALGIAGTQTFGLRENFGTMTKPMHPGQAAKIGLMAALLAQKGFTSSKRILEAPRGFANVTSRTHDLERVLENWGTVWELEQNAFKPYACGIVLHPAIEAAIRLGQLAKPDQVEAIEVRVNPYVLELTSNPTPRNGLQGKFSINHVVAAGFIDGDACEDQFHDERVTAPDVIAVREKVKMVPTAAVGKEQVEAVLRLKNGTTHTVRIDHAIGSLENPMTQAMLNAKFTKLCRPYLTANQIERTIDAVMRMEELPSIGEVISGVAQ